MCGIIGAINSNYCEKIYSAIDTIKSRGPDATKIIKNGNTLLGHTRLSVIDIEDGHQPMVSEDQRFSLCFNGEIYNYKELRSDLESQGITFKTKSDTEVLLNALITWGKHGITKLNGMFAFALWDSYKKELLLARDRLGIKPLYYATKNGFIFSSSAKSFLQFDSIFSELSPNGIRDFLGYHTTLSPETIFKHVHQLPPAHFLVWSEKNTQIERYWEIDHFKNGNQDFEELLFNTEKVLSDSIKRQMVADVPIGAFLSGGIDSSLLVHYASNYTSSLKTFSVQFEGNKYDETNSALDVSKKYSTDHTIIPAKEIGPDELIEAISHLDQPLSDPAYVPTYFLSKATKKHVTVSLSGDGADELFGGYGRYLRTIDNYPDSISKNILKKLIEFNLSPGALTRQSLAGPDMMLYLKTDLAYWHGGRKAFNSWINKEFLEQTDPKSYMSNWISEVLRLKCKGAGYTEALMKADLSTYLSENCLVKTDRASMGHGLEVRVPYLDNTVIDLTERAANKFLIDQSNTKKPLFTLAKKNLPESVWNRPKHGFSVPLKTNLSGAWKEVLTDSLNDLAGEKWILMDQKTIQPIKNNSNYYTSVIYSLLVLSIWRKSF